VVFQGEEAGEFPPSLAFAFSLIL